MNTPGRAYLREFLAAVVAYVVILLLSVFTIQAYPNTPLLIPLALAPLVPALVMVLAVVRFVGRVDELQRRIQLEALAFAFPAAAVLAFSYGLLEDVGFPRLSWTWVVPLMVALWGIGLALAVRRYR